MSRYEDRHFGGPSFPCTRPSRIVIDRITKSTLCHLSARSSLGRTPVRNAVVKYASKWGSTEERNIFISGKENGSMNGLSSLNRRMNSHGVSFTSPRLLASLNRHF